METEPINSRAEKVVVKNRFNDKLYTIGYNDYMKITDLISLYHESIYNFPDEEMVVAYPLIEQKSDKCYMKLNELVFI